VEQDVPGCRGAGSDGPVHGGRLAVILLPATQLRTRVSAASIPLVGRG
jgi:hypothetical protein